MRIRATLATAAVALAILPVADAAATPQSNIQAELQAGGVPSPNVAVATPTAAIATDVSAFEIPARIDDSCRPHCETERKSSSVRKSRTPSCSDFSW